MGTLREIESHAAFGGVQKVVEHDSDVLGCTMRLGVFLPPQAVDGRAVEGQDQPVLIYLSGLTCTEQNVITKGGAQRWCAEHGLVFVAPDTSPRGDDVPDDDAWDLGQGAGFYLTATQAPWAEHYRMDEYVTDELPALIRAFSTSDAYGLFGHSMGGHGALTLALKHPGRYRSVSALAPILQPLDVPWGQKAFAAYLGSDRQGWREAWAAHDAASLIPSASERLPLLIDQGDADPFLAEQLHSERFLAACEAAGHPVTYRLQPGYDHSYYFVASFMADHVAHHARYLTGTAGDDA